MLIRVPRGWEIPENGATDRSIYLNRRRLLKLATVATAVLVAPGTMAEAQKSLQDSSPSPIDASVPRNPRYAIDRPLTPEKLAARHNIFDEFGSDRTEIWKIAQDFVADPWRVHIGGAVEKQLTFDVGELERLLGVEERLYRHRCVETWAMAVPWSGMPLAGLVRLAKPLAKARYLRMVSFGCSDQLPGWFATKRVFPYYEALSLEEATNELAFLATGIYGHRLPPQHGAPLRLVVPWKYGLKSLKSIVAFQFTEKRPGTFWNDLSPQNYSWESNVDPRTTDPWPQAMETMLGSDTPRETLPFNGYGDYVQNLYS